MAFLSIAGAKVKEHFLKSITVDWTSRDLSDLSDLYELRDEGITGFPGCVCLALRATDDELCQVFLFDGVRCVEKSGRFGLIFLMRALTFYDSKTCQFSAYSAVAGRLTKLRATRRIAILQGFY